MLVAIAAENLDYDVSVYERLLALCLSRPVEAWRDHDVSFSGVGSVFALGNVFLDRAAKAGVKRALVAVDNDGGLQKRLPHDSAHARAEQVDTPEGCRYCKLEDRIAHIQGLDLSLAVPVQAIETWLLVANDSAFKNPIPEMNFHRTALKKRFYGPKPPAAERTKAALDALSSAGALVRLRERPSFQQFEAQLSAW
jgi:hypothetical protein